MEKNEDLPEWEPPPLGRFGVRRPRGLKTYSVTFLESEVEELDAVAKAEGKSRSELIREMLHLGLAQRGHDLPE